MATHQLQELSELSQREAFTVQNCHPVNLPLSDPCRFLKLAPYLSSPAAREIFEKKVEDVDALFQRTRLCIAENVRSPTPPKQPKQQLNHLEAARQVRTTGPG